MPRNKLKNISILTLVMAVVAVLLAIQPVAPVNAQDNLLTDPGFENTGVWKTVAQDQDSGTTFSVAPAWNGWFTETPSSADWQNILPNGAPHNRTSAGDPFVREGNRAQNLGRGFGTFTAAVFQNVAVPAGSNVIGSAWAVMDLDLNANPNATARVGIDPNGGNNPLDTDVVWSSSVVNAIGAYQQMTVNATATGPSVTLFLWASQSQPSDPNGVFWDDASLTIGGGGGVAPGQATQVPANTPVPTAPPSVPLVPPQAPEADGAQYHIIRSGDTIASIAVAYGVRSAEIIELNNIANPGLISIGQRLLIRPAPTLAPPTDAPEEDPTARPTRTPRPSRTPADTANTDVDSAALDDTGDSEATSEADMVEEVATEEIEPTNTPTVTPSSTPTPTDPPTATPAAVAEASGVDLAATTASLCIMIYEDINADTERQTDETTLAGGSVLLQRDGTEIQSMTLDGSEDMSCFEELEPGQYIVDATAPEGFVLLPSSRSRPNLPVGQQVNVAFAAVDSASVANIPAPEVNAPNNPETAADLALEETLNEDDNSLLQNAGLIVLGLAALTLVTGVVVSLALRGR